MKIVIQSLLANVPRKLPVYDVIPPAWSEQEVRELAGRFGVEGPLRAAHHGHRTRVNGAGGTFEVFTASRSVRWSRATADSREPTTPVNIDDKEAVSRACKFLEDRGLKEDWTRHAGEPSVYDMQVARQERGERVPAEYICIGKYVNFAFNVEHEGYSYAVTGPGAKMQVVIGHDGEVREVYRFWRDLRFRETRDRTSASVMLHGLASMLHGLASATQWAFGNKSADAKTAATVVLEVTFLTLPPREQQSMLIPFTETKIHHELREGRPVEFVRWLHAVDSSDRETEWLKPMSRMVF